MYRGLKELVYRALEEEADKIYNSDANIVQKIEKQNDVFNLVKVIEHYEELEPLIAQYLNGKAIERYINNIDLDRR